MSTALLLVNEVLRRLGQMEVTTLDSLQTPGLQALDFLNETYWEMLQRLKVNQLLEEGVLTTTAGVSAYSVDDNASVDTILSDSLLDIDTQQPLVAVDYAYPSQKGMDVVGRPYAFYKLGEQVVLYPTPDAEYNIRYFYLKTPVNLVLDGDIPLLPDSAGKVLILGAQARLEKFLGENGSDTYLLYRDALDRLRSRSPLKPAYRMQGFYRGYRGPS